MKNLVWRLALAALVLLYASAALAPFLAPYRPHRQFRDFANHPPTPIHFVDESGSFSLRPFVYVTQSGAEAGPATGAVSEEKRYVQFFVRGEAFSWLGIQSNLHCIGLGEEPGLFLLGTDDLGRDLFSRILAGSQFSLGIGLAGLIFTMTAGVALGALAGYYGGWTDRLIMRFCDLFLSLPGLFLVLGIRAVFPLEMSNWTTFWLIVLTFTLIGWGVVSRVIRGQVLSLKERTFVLAARAAGASSGRILLKHILPFTTSYLQVQAAVFIPLFILGEITLSFLGVGVQEPDVSLGTLLMAANSLFRISSYPWLLAPAGVIFLILLSFNLIGERMQAFARVTRRWW